jgi:hypothetical protein
MPLGNGSGRESYPESTLLVPYDQANRSGAAPVVDPHFGTREETAP